MAQPVTEVREMLRRQQTEPSQQVLSVHPRLAPVFPQGLRAGAVHTLTGSWCIGVALLATASQQGWCAAVGMPDLSVESVARWGGVLDQLVLVPSPERFIWDTVGTLVDAVDFVLTAPAPIAPAHARRLEARLRSRRTALVTLGDWPGSTIDIQAHTLGWSGLSDGFGALTEQHVEVTVTERSRRRTTRVMIPDRP